MKNAIVAALLTMVSGLLSTQRVMPLEVPDDAPASQSFSLTFPGTFSQALTLGAVAVDGAGNIYLAGGTTTTYLPAINPEMPKRGSKRNAFVTKFAPSGRPLWTSFIGGTTGRSAAVGDPGGDYAMAIAVDRAGDVVVAGRTFSTDFPTANAFQGVAQAIRFGAADGFVTKLSSDGKRVIYSSYFGARSADSRLSALAVGPDGEVWVAGASSSAEIATHFNVSDPDSNHVILLKLDPAGAVIWSTRMSGTNVYDLDVDPSGQPHIAAGCWAPSDVMACSPFVSKLSRNGTQQLYRERVSAGGNQPFRLSVTEDGEAVASGGAGGVSQPVNPWPSSWGLAGLGFVRVLDPSARTLSLNNVDTSGIFGPVYTAVAERLIVAFNTTSRDLPTSRELPMNEVDQAPRDVPFGFAMSISGAGSSAERTWATYLQDGTVFDLTTTSSGDAVAALVRWGDHESVVTLVRIGE